VAAVVKGDQPVFAVVALADFEAVDQASHVAAALGPVRTGDVPPHVADDQLDDFVFGEAAL
jgi:hypothetical protein